MFVLATASLECLVAVLFISDVIRLFVVLEAIPCWVLSRKDSPFVPLRISNPSQRQRSSVRLRGARRHLSGLLTPGQDMQNVPVPTGSADR